MKKSLSSYVKSLDSFYPIKSPQKFDNKDEISYDDEIGELRIKLFLEDLGPIEMYQEHEKKIEEEILAKGINSKYFFPRNNK